MTVSTGEYIVSRTRSIVSLLVVFAFMGLSSLVSRGARLQQSRLEQSTYKVSGVEVPLVLTDVVTSRRNLEPAWSLPGYWSGVSASVKDGTIYAAAPAVDAATTTVFAAATMPGHLRQIDFNGKILREIPIAAFRSVKLVVAHFSQERDPVFLMFGSFVDHVSYLTSQACTHSTEVELIFGPILIYQASPISPLSTRREITGNGKMVRTTALTHHATLRLLGIAGVRKALACCGNGGWTSLRCRCP